MFERHNKRLSPLYFQIEMNTTTAHVSIENDELFNKYMRSINFILSCTGLFSNLLLIIVLLLIGRRQCATYFLLILMALCDFLYCIVYISIALTVDQYINIINHQIICPLSFFLTPFTFTGSTLLLFICLLHFITNYVRQYDTILGQLGGRLSVIFVLAFIIIRSVLSSTSIELIVPDSHNPHIKFCTIDMNTPTLVATIQKINHIFAEVTDILVYLGWIIILLIYIIKVIRCKKSYSYDQTDITLSRMVQPFSYASLLIVSNNINHDQHVVATARNSSDLLNIPHEITTTAVITNKQRHNDVSLIILSISLLSIIFYLPIMITKYSTMYFFYSNKLLLQEGQIIFLQIFQHTAHLFCLSVRIFPYFLFDKRIRLCFNQMFGMKCMMTRKKTLSKKRKYNFKQKYTWHCQCYRRQQILEFNNNENEQTFIRN
jgi:hypothetical protein